MRRSPLARPDVLVNGLGLATAAASAAVGLRRPGFSSPSAPQSELARFWAASSAVRTWALTAAVLRAVARDGEPPGDLLAAAGLVQIGDGVLGIWRRNRRMAVLPTLMGAVHLWAARGQQRARAPTTSPGHSEQA